MSFREKSAWASIATFLVIFGVYFWEMADVIVAGETETYPYYSLLVGFVIASIVVEIILQAIVAARVPDEANAARDEREKLIDLKATYIAFYVLVIGALAAAGAIAWDIQPFYTANGLFLTVVVTEVVKYAGEIVYFRRGV